MKNQSKNKINFILCLYHRNQCWWPWKVCGNVSSVLQIRKTTKIRMTFLRIHYNRDLNANGHLPLCDISASFGGTRRCRGQNDLLQRLLGFRSSASNISNSSTSCHFSSELNAVAQTSQPQSFSPKGRFLVRNVAIPKVL